MRLPEDFKKRMEQMLGAEYGRFEQAFCTGSGFGGIRVNDYKPGAWQRLAPYLDGLEPVPWCENGYYCTKEILDGSHPYHRAGLFYFQEPSAMSAAEGIPILPGDRVLDLCAAPGGKSTQIAAKLKGEGILVSNEIVAKRAAVLSENIERMGFANVVVTNESPAALERKFPAYFDKIIVDAPCSGEGMFRKEERAAAEWSREHTVACGIRQRHILDSALAMLAPGGFLLYSTCTFAPEENEAAAEYVLKQYPHMILADMPRLSMLSPGRGEWIGSDLDLSKTRRIYPHLHQGEGHFIALFQSTAPKASGREKPIRGGKEKDREEMVKLYREFEKHFLRISLEERGELTAFGDHLYLKPRGVCLDGVRVVRCGLYLGVCKKGRFEPAHALAPALNQGDFVNQLLLEADNPALAAYIRGEEIDCGGKGWTAVLADGFGIGWGKASGGRLKNRYPKALRGIVTKNR